MQRGYKPRGWLVRVHSHERATRQHDPRLQGLIIGTRMYYSFHGSELDDDAVFEERMEALVRELGDRGLARATPVPEAVPPALAPAPAPVSAPAPAPAAPAPTAGSDQEDGQPTVTWLW